jgi:hypothetical protein
VDRFGPDWRIGDDIAIRIASGFHLTGKDERSIRVLAVLAAILFVVINLRLAFGIATLGFAIGAWSGLKDYQLLSPLPARLPRGSPALNFYYLSLLVHSSTESLMGAFGQMGWFNAYNRRTGRVPESLQAHPWHCVVPPDEQAQTRSSTGQSPRL